MAADGDNERGYDEYICGVANFEAPSFGFERLARPLRRSHSVGFQAITSLRCKSYVRDAIGHFISPGPAHWGYSSSRASLPDPEYSSTSYVAPVGSYGSGPVPQGHVASRGEMPVVNESKKDSSYTLNHTNPGTGQPNLYSIPYGSNQIVRDWSEGEEARVRSKGSGSGFRTVESPAASARRTGSDVQGYGRSASYSEDDSTNIKEWRSIFQNSRASLSTSGGESTVHKLQTNHALSFPPLQHPTVYTVHHPNPSNNESRRTVCRDVTPCHADSTYISSPEQRMSDTRLGQPIGFQRRRTSMAPNVRNLSSDFSSLDGSSWPSVERPRRNLLDTRDKVQEDKTAATSAAASAATDEDEEKEKGSERAASSGVPLAPNSFAPVIPPPSAHSYGYGASPPFPLSDGTHSPPPTHTYTPSLDDDDGDHSCTTPGTNAQDAIAIKSKLESVSNDLFEGLPHRQVLETLASKATGPLGKDSRIHTRALESLVRLAWKLTIHARASFAFDYGKLLVCDEGVFELDCDQEWLRYRGKDCDSEDGEWIEGEGYSDSEDPEV